MPTSRRQFIKRGAGAVTLSVVMPKLWVEGRAQGVTPSASNRKLVVIQLSGGNDGLNTVVPYADARYAALRPNLAFKDAELKDAQGQSTIISDKFGLHPSLSKLKGLYDQNKVAVVLGVGYPDSNLSHFLSTDIWQTANTNGGQGDGWLGKYADLALAGQSGMTAVAIGGSLPKSFFADKVVIPNISNFASYDFQTDNRYRGDSANQISTFNKNYARNFSGGFIREINTIGSDAVRGAAQVREATALYTSTVQYPAGNQLASALKMAAQILATVPEAQLLHVNMGGFDHHSQEIGSTAEPANKLVGELATRLGWFSDAVKAFYDDLAEHNLADQVLMLEWSEFGRRPNENASFGSDHGTANALFVIGNPVRGGIYGEQPSLEATALDRGGNMVSTVDFRAVYATILDKWLGANPAAVLGGSFENVGFLG